MRHGNARQPFFRDGRDRYDNRHAPRRRSRSRSPAGYREEDSRSSNRSRSSRSSRSSSYSSRSSRSRSSHSSGDDSSRAGRNGAAAAAADPFTKDQRTVFVSQLVMRAQERDIKKYFKAQAIKVNDIIMLRDKRTGRHKGCAYVELRNLDDLSKAVLLSNIVPDFQKFPLLIMPSQAEKNYSAAAPAPKQTTSNKPPQVYLGNLDARVTQDQLDTLFSTFGDLESVQLQTDSSTGLSRGFCFLRYHDARDANLAIQTMAGQLLAGRPLKTGWATAAVGASAEFPPDATLKIKDAHATLAELTGDGLFATATVDATVIGNDDTPTCTVLVHNVFDKDEETDKGWEEDIRLDFEEECSKFGKIIKVVVIANEPGGKIYTTFSNTNEAKECASNLAGRWFDKRQLRVEFVESIPGIVQE